MANGTDEIPPGEESVEEADDRQDESYEPNFTIPEGPPDEQDSNEFAKHSVEYWTTAGEKARKAYYEQIDLLYTNILKEFFEQANASAVQHRTYSRRHLQTRRRTIILTGTLALLNVIIAYTVNMKGDGTETGLLALAYSGIVLIPLAGALYATALTVYSSLESLYGYSGRAQAFREVRELFLNAARQSELTWNVYVRPFGYTAPACVNAAIAFEKIVEKDIEVRGQAKELVESRDERAEPGAGT